MPSPTCCISLAGPQTALAPTDKAVVEVGSQDVTTQDLHAMAAAFLAETQMQERHVEIGGAVSPKP